MIPPFNDLSYDEYRRGRPYEAPMQLSVSTTRTYPTENLDFEVSLTKYEQYSLSQFWTLLVNFKIWIDDSFFGIGSILTRDGRQVGLIHLHRFEESELFEKHEVFDFILLSGAWKEMDDGNTESTTYFAMLLQWDEPIAQRRGSGEVEKSAITQGWPPGPKWKQIILC
jgi:hypothetical protein